MFVAIDSLQPNKHHVVDPANLTVTGTATSGCTVWVKVLGLTDPIPADPSSDASWKSASVDAGGEFSVANVLGATTLAVTGAANNKAVAFAKSGFQSATDIVYFRGRPKVESIPVPATSCMWFAFAPLHIPGPTPVGGDPTSETDTANHIPPSCVVPVNVSACRVTTMGNWSHGGAISNADGSGPANIKLQNPLYSSDTFNSRLISDMPFEVNRLIAMWVDIDQVPIGDPFKLGDGLKTIARPTDAKWIYFAFHDGKRWHNNSGQVSMMLDWTVVNNIKFLRRPRIER